MKHFLLTGLTAVLLLPGTAYAYVEPEDVLFGNGDILDDGSSSSRSSAAVSSDDGLHGAAPDETVLTPREERILDRVGRLQQSSSAPSYYPPASQDETLHSGAPLAHTGPETVIALSLLAVAMGATLLMARNGRIDIAQK